MGEEADKASCRLYSEGCICRCNLQLKQNGKIWMTTNKVVDQADAHAIFEINSFFLQENVSLKSNKRNGIILPDVINLENKVQISRDRGFPFILNCSEIKLPIKVNNSSKKRITILLTMLDPATDPGGILAADQVSCPPSESENLPDATQSGNLANPAQITFGYIQDAANCLSLPPAARNFLL